MRLQILDVRLINSNHYKTLRENPECFFLELLMTFLWPFRCDTIRGR